jgi:hypothetical protein
MILVIAGLQASVAENLDADQPDRRRHPQTVLPQLFERRVACALEIHGHAIDEILEGRSRQRKLLDVRQELPALLRRRRATLIQTPNFLPPLIEGTNRISLARFIHGVVNGAAEIPYGDDGISLGCRKRKE